MRPAIPLVCGLAAAGLALASAAQGAPKRKAQTGVASYYHPSLAGRPTASGAPLKPRALTAASPTLPLGTKAKVTNAETGQSVNVTVTDRGPFAKGRILDVTPKAAEKLGMKDDGVAKVKVQPLHVPPKKGEGS